MSAGPESRASARILGEPIVRMGTVTSTMDVVRRMEAMGAAEGTTVVASRQTNGRGRAGRAWQSPEAAGLYCSILLRPRIPLSWFQGFSIAAGLALCDALDAQGDLGLCVKWPNDLLCGDRKLAGILITASSIGVNAESAILGIGLNLQPDPNRPDHAISLAELVGGPVQLAEDPLPDILRALTGRYDAVVRGDSAMAIQGWEHRLALLDRLVTVRDGERTLVGRLAGLDDRGALLLETAGQIVAVAAGELTRGPQPTSG